MGLIPGQEDSPGEGNGNPLQYCCLKNPMDRRARWATVQRVPHDWMTERSLMLGVASQEILIEWLEQSLKGFMLFFKKRQTEIVVLKKSSITTLNIIWKVKRNNPYLQSHLANLLVESIYLVVWSLCLCDQNYGSCPFSLNKSFYGLP